MEHRNGNPLKGTTIVPKHLHDDKVIASGHLALLVHGANIASRAPYYTPPRLQTNQLFALSNACGQATGSYDPDDQEEDW
jgi:hypothetical protein